MRNDFEPRLATEWKQLDDTTLQMKLRPGVTFTNGEPFNAESAKISIEMVIEVAIVRRVRQRDRWRGSGRPHTLNIKTKSPTLLHMPALAQGSFQYPPSTSRRQVQDGFGKKPIGTGPYTFGEWVKDSRVTLEANPAVLERRPGHQDGHLPEHPRGRGQAGGA